MGRVKKNILPVVAVILFLAGSFGLGSYAGKINTKSKKPPAEVIQQWPADRDVLYSEILPAGEDKNKSGIPAGQRQEEKTRVVRSAPEAGQIENEMGIPDTLQQQFLPQEPAWKDPAEANKQVQECANGKCVYIHDGDTISVRLDKSPQQLTRVRLIGVDAPELAPGEFGEIARDYARSLLQNQKVKLVYDEEKYDKYGRTLAYVYLQDGTFINARLIERGYVRVMTIKPNTSYTEEFEKLQHEAQKARRGIWADPPPKYTWRDERVVTEWIF